MRSSIPWSEQEIVTPNIPNTGSKLLQPLPHFENYCSDSTRRYRLPSGHVSFLPSPRCLVTPALSPHLLFVWCSFFCFPVLSQCAGWSGRPTGDEHLQPMLCSEGGGRKETHFPELRTLRATFKIKPQALSLHTESPTSTTLTCTDIPQTAAPGKLCREAQPGPSAASLHQLWAQPHDAREGFCFPSPLLFCCGLGTFLSARWCPLTCGRAEFGAGVCYAGSALCDLCQDAILCKSSDFGSILPILH